MGLLASSGLVSGLLLVGLALTAAALLMRASSRLSRRPIASRPIVDSRCTIKPRTGNSADQPPDLAQWEVQMHETARDLSGQLTSRISALMALVAEADRAAARLEAALAKSRRSASRAGTHSDEDAQPTVACTPGHETADDPRAAQTGIERASVQPDTETPGGSLAAEQAAPGQSRPLAAIHCSRRQRDEICLLADYGYEPAEISRRTSTPLGEVELVLSRRVRV